ncbi:MAG: hypothetical protein CM15mV26_0300 [uncultured marine virus]|nr:MAG: hypothetical protein CM15mV26_0300 [uncultured marine virus]
METENFIRGKVDLVKEQNSSSFECFNDWSIVPDGCTVNKAETANEIIFISFNSNVYTDEFSSELGARLFDRKRFTVARETRDKRRVEYTGLNNLLRSPKLPNLTKVSSLVGIRFCSIAGIAGGA